MNFREPPEKELVAGHRVENARSGEDHTIGSAEGGDEDGKGHELAGPGTENGSDGCSRDGVAGGHVLRAEGEEVGDNSEEIEPNQSQGAEQKGAGECFLRVNDFAGAGGAEL